MTVDESVLNLIVGAFVFAYGASIGSFLNVVAWRLPRGRALFLPASSCPHCGGKIPVYALIPVFGYLFIRGKCVHCGTKISAHYPLVELITGVLTLIVFFKFMGSAELVSLFTGDAVNGELPLGRFRFQSYAPMFTALWILYSGIPLSLIDIELRILPDKITKPGMLVSFLIACANPLVGWDGGLKGALLGAGSLYAIAKFYEIVRKREGLGLGDVKYLGLIGAALGWQGVIWTIALASFIGMFYGVSLGIIKRQGLNVAIPFGPFLATGAYIVSIWGNEIQEFFYRQP